MTHEGYEALARLEGALAHYADAAYAQLDKQAQADARRIFLRLIYPDERVANVKRPARQTELSEQQWSTAGQLADQRLLVMGQDAAGVNMVELAHEALIRHWEQLQYWLATERTFHQWLHRLRAALDQWLANKQDEGALLRGQPLVEAETWLATHRAELGQKAQEFIEASIDLRQREEAEALLQQQRERAYTLALEARLALMRHAPEEALSLALQANEGDDPPAMARLILSETAYAPGTRKRFGGHEGGISEIVLNAEKNVILSAGRDKTVLCRRVNDGSLICRFTGHEAAVQSVTIAPNGQTAVSADASGQLIHWRLDDGQMIGAWSGQQGIIRRVRFLPDGSRVLSAGDDGVLYLWDVHQGTVLDEFHGHTDKVYALALSPNGRFALSGGADHDLLLWDIEAGRLAHRFPGYASILPLVANPQGHYGHIWDVAFLPDGKTAVSVGDETRLIVWDCSAGKMVRQFMLKNNLRCLAIASDGRSAAVGTMHKQIITVDIETGTVGVKAQGHHSRITSAVYLDERSLFTGAMDGDIRLWDLRNGAEKRQWRAEEDETSMISLGLTPDGRLGLFGSVPGILALQEIATGKTIRRWQAHDDVIFGGCEIDATGKWAVSGSGDIYGRARDCSVRVWDITTGEEVRRFTGHRLHVRDVAFSPNGRFVLSGGFDGQVRYGSVVDGAESVLLDVYPQAAMCVAVTPDARHAVIGLGAGTHQAPDYAIRYIDIATGRESMRLYGHSEAISHLTFSPDAHYLLSASFDNTLRLWDMATGACLHTLTGHQDAPCAAAFSPNGQWMVSAGLDNDLLLWDIDLGVPLRRWAGHTATVLGVAFTPDGREVISVGDDMTTRVWRMDATHGSLLNWIREHRYTPVNGR